MKFRRIALRVFAAMFLYMSICYLYMSSLSPKDFLSITGRLRACYTVHEKGVKYNHRPLYIELVNFSHRFRLMDVYDDWFPMVQANLNSGDTVSVYYRTALQSFIGMGKRYDSYLIYKGDKLVFPFSATRKQNLFSFKMMLFLSILFFGLSFLIKKKTSANKSYTQQGQQNVISTEE
jgi:hypothetical protein